MKILASLIKRRLEAQVEEWGHCAVYEDELQRLWPLNEKNRKQKIEQFANEYGFHLSFYKPGLSAIFERETGSAARCTIIRTRFVTEGQQYRPVSAKKR